MKSFKILLVVLSCILVLSFAGNVIAGGNRVLFYEAKTSGKYTTDGDYLKFVSELKNEGYIVYATKEISTNTLKSYDVLVIPNIGTPLEPKELAAVSEFVIENGGGLFIAGAATETANQITPFGMTVDKKENLLEDDMNCIKDATAGKCKEKTNFVVTTFSTDPMVQSIRIGVNQLGFYGGSGIYLSGNAKPVAMGGRTTYALAGSFPPESNPPVAAAAIVGKGLVFLLSDPDMLSEKNLDNYDNLKFGVNIIKWLSISSQVQGNTSIQELGVIIGELRIERDEFSSSLNKVRSELNNVTNAYVEQSDELDLVIEERDACKGAKLFGFDYITVGILMFGLFIVIAAVIISRRGKKTEKKPEIEELGYELEGLSGEEGLDIGGGKLEDVASKEETSPNGDEFK